MQESARTKQHSPRGAGGLISSGLNACLFGSKYYSNTNQDSQHPPVSHPLTLRAKYSPMTSGSNLADGYGSMMKHHP